MIERVLVYRLYESQDLSERDTMVERYLAGAGPGQAIEPQYASLGGGCFRWSDTGRLDRNTRPDLLPRNEVDARKAAISFMTKANEAASRYRTQRGLNIEQHPNPFALESLLPGSARRVRSRVSGHDDHWMTSWNIWLPSSHSQTRSLVVGATLEIRLGARGQVVSVVSYVRPWRAVVSRPALPWPQDEHGHKDEPALVYVADPPSERLRFLSPCWLVPPDDEEDHHARRLWPACDHSVLPEIVIEEHDGTATAWPVVLTPDGGSFVTEHGDEWKVRWAIASLEQFIRGDVEASSGTNAHLRGPGLYQVALEVEHVPTGAVRSTHRQVSLALRDVETSHGVA